MSTLQTDFNVDPYYDDYDVDKKFTRILFKPSIGVQTRELTQMQTILQAQIERFGNNIYKEGTIIEGCAISFDSEFSYVKILDNSTDGITVLPSSYLGLEARGTVSNVYAVVNAYADGLVSQDPNLTTLYIDYFQTGLSEKKVFDDNENIDIYDSGNNLIVTVTAAGASVNNAVGDAFAVSCSEGIIYSKGHFLTVSARQVLASKYGNAPSQVSIGFDVAESIITSDSDTSLLDNAAGFNNENAPGADRLKLDPYLVAIPTSDAQANTDFLSLIDFQNGLPIGRRITTQFNSITDEMALRTLDESGNYTIRKNEFSTADTTSNTYFHLLAGPGLHYVNGFRREQLNTTRVPMERATANSSIADITVTTNLGHYLVVNEYIGNFSSELASEISLRDTAGTSITDSDAVSIAPGTEIGKAYVRAVEHNDGIPGTSTGQFKLYIFNVRMNEGKAFKDVKAVHIASAATADVVLVNGEASILERNSNFGLFPLPKRAIKATSSSDYVYRTKTNKAFTANSGVVTFNGLPYSGTLTNTQKREFILIPNTTASGLTVNEPINTDLVSMIASGSNITMDFTSAVTSPLVQTISIISNEKRTNVTPLTKTLRTVFVQVDSANSVANTVGPWSLGLPDVNSIEAVYQANSTQTINSTSESWMSDITSSFELEKNQYDVYYGLSEISKKPTQTLTAGDQLLVKVNVFDSTAPAAGAGFYTINSYVDDLAAPLDPSDIPLYFSEDTGYTFDLRDMLDVRPQMDKTAAVATTIAASTVNPSTTEAFSGSELYMAAPNKQFQTDLQYYLGRIDKVLITEQGYLTTRKGTPSSTPIPPPDVPGSMVLATVAIPPFPSLTPDVARSKARKSEAVSISPRNTKRYTMDDIGKIDKRLRNIEYYTTLSLLEQKTTNMSITDANGNDRFKNGILVDPATDFSISDVNNREFRIGLEPTASEFVPQFDQEIIDLAVANSSNVQEIDGVFFLQGGNQIIINQQGATTALPCTENYYKYTGKIAIDPTYDGGFETSFLPAKNVVSDLANSGAGLAAIINNIYPFTRTSIEKIGSSTDILSETTISTDESSADAAMYGWDGYSSYQDSWNNGLYDYPAWVGDYGSGGVGTTSETAITTTTTAITDTYQKTTQQLAVGVAEATAEVGDFVKDITYTPFMRARRIRVAGWGFKPSTRHYFFFDKKNINTEVRPGRIDSIAASSWSLLDNPSYVYPIGNAGAAVYSDANGFIHATFDMPAGTYFVGDRQLVIADVASIYDIPTSTSTGTITYSAYNFSVTRQNVSVTTRTPTYDITNKVEVFSEQSLSTDVSANTVVKPTSNDPYTGANTANTVVWTDPLPTNVGNTTTTTTGTGDAGSGITGSGGYDWDNASYGDLDNAYTYWEQLDWWSSSEFNF